MSEFKMHLVSIEVNNFKSFSGYSTDTSEAISEPAHEASHIIGPFTHFTGIIGPNGVGKSNIFDAIAFALNISLAPGKVRHARDLAHIPKRIAEHLDQQERENASQEFFVKLNLLKIDSQGKYEKLSLQRGLKRKANADGEHSYYNEYIVNENFDRPLLFEEYKQLLLTVYNLDIQEFAIYQNQLESLCFGEQSSQKLTAMIEKLSGSA